VKQLLALLIAMPLAAQTRIASDFEIQQMEQQIAKSGDFSDQYAGHLNLGDLRATRSENVQARAEYRKAFQIATEERLYARRVSDMTRYSTATLLAAGAMAHLHDDARAFELAEEGMRYASDSARNWNLYANMMSLLERDAKAASAARNAVAIEERNGEPLDLAIYRYTLASELLELKEDAEAERLLLTVVASLRSPAFAKLQKSVREHEAFETYNTTRSDESAYVSLLNRTQHRLASMYEKRGDAARAQEQYRNVLAARSDDADALAGMARLARGEDRAKYFIDAFNANPFSVQLIDDYLGEQRAASGERTGTTGDQVRLVIDQIKLGELSTARATLDALTKKFPNNDALLHLQREIDKRRTAGALTLAPSRELIVAFQDNTVTPEQRKQLDTMTFTNTVVFDAGPPFETGRIDALPFRFSGPTEFHGTYAAHVPLWMTYRILGATRVGDADALLLEPLKVEVIP
jgi:hypothetical protein